jgi:RHS repeat-associated protein
VRGEKLTTMNCQYDVLGTGTGGQRAFNCTQANNVYFAGRLVKRSSAQVETDRLGTVHTSGSTPSYYPWGEESGTVTADGKEKWATYTRDNTLSGLDYARQRYYNPKAGRFWSADPAGPAAANSRDPVSWNRYAYVGGDPVNRLDPGGTEYQCTGPEDDRTCEYVAWEPWGGDDDHCVTASDRAGGATCNYLVLVAAVGKKGGSAMTAYDYLRVRRNKVAEAVDAGATTYLSANMLECWAGIESAFYASVVVGTYSGLFQLDAAAWAASGIGVPFTAENASNPALNTQAAVGYLYYLLYKYVDPAGVLSYNITAQDVVQALTDYRWGPNAKDKSSTYANKIMACAKDLDGGNWDAAMAEIGKKP